MEELKGLLPNHLLVDISGLKKVDKLQEIRIRVNEKVMYNVDNKEVVSEIILKDIEMKSILSRISNYSIYAFEEEIRQGFITIRGGHRVGITGHWIMDQGSVKAIKSIHSINIRVCRERIGCANTLIPYIVNNGKVQNTIIVSPPKCGKTTIIRDISRILSDEYKKKISLMDERSEIAACYNGVPQLKVGQRTDIYDNCVKSLGMMMAIRCMSPDIIICDEIGTEADMDALLAAFNCGVNIIATIHGNNEGDVFRRPTLKKLIENNILDKIITLSGSNGPGTLERVTDLREKKGGTEGAD